MQAWQAPGSPPRLKPQRRRTALTALLWGALFALAYGQSPLYTCNQHQYSRTG